MPVKMENCSFPHGFKSVNGTALSNSMNYMVVGRNVAKLYHKQSVVQRLKFENKM